MRCVRLCCFFFFQAEDGIRDVAVTGVQTCALPIYIFNQKSKGVTTMGRLANKNILITGGNSGIGLRSEERRVGKECRSRWGAEQYKKYNLNMEQAVLI